MANSVFTFPYQYKRSDPGPIINPLVPAFVQAPWGWQKLWFLVDSGADTTTVTRELADHLGLQYDVRQKTDLCGVGEHKVEAFLGHITLKLGTWEMVVRSYVINDHDSSLLLGRLDVFDRLTVCFDHIKKQVIFIQ